MLKPEPQRHLKDPAALTPYEQKIWDMRQQGLTNQQIGEAMNQLPGSIASRIKVIKEKVELQDALRMVG
jgi:DNA-binding NarL/FixJ family response regulator